MVYVDPLFKCAWGPGGRYKMACHMFAGTRRELHKMARTVGLKPEWFQDVEGGLPHYDLTPGMRLLAVRAGAAPLTTRAAAKKIKEIKTRRRRKEGRTW